MASHTLIAREVIPRQLAVQFFQTLRNCTEAELETTVNWIERATIKLSLSDCVEDLKKFAKTRNIPISQPESVLEALFALEGLRSSLNWPANELLQYLIEQTKGDPAPSENFDEAKFKLLLERFFGNSAKLERTLKAQRIYDGLLPNFESSSSLVEFRPVFDEARENIVNGIVAATMIIETRATGPESDVARLVFQLDATDVEQLIRELNYLKQKLQVLKAMAASHTDLLNPSRSLQVENQNVG